MGFTYQSHAIVGGSGIILTPLGFQHALSAQHMSVFVFRHHRNVPTAALIEPRTRLVLLKLKGISTDMDHLFIYPVFVV